MLILTDQGRYDLQWHSLCAAVHWSIAAAMERGVRFGRPEKPLPDDFSKLVYRWEIGALPFGELIRRCGMSEATFYRRLRSERSKGK